MKLELSGTTKLPFASKLFKHVRRYLPNAEKCHVNVSIEDVYVKAANLACVTLTVIQIPLDIWRRPSDNF